MIFSCRPRFPPPGTRAQREETGRGGAQWTKRKRGFSHLSLRLKGGLTDNHRVVPLVSGPVRSDEPELGLILKMLPKGVRAFLSFLPYKENRLGFLLSKGPVNRGFGGGGRAATLSHPFNQQIPPQSRGEGPDVDPIPPLTPTSPGCTEYFLRSRVHTQGFPIFMSNFWHSRSERRRSVGWRSLETL